MTGRFKKKDRVRAKNGTMLGTVVKVVKKEEPRLSLIRVAWDNGHTGAAAAQSIEKAQERQ